MQIQPFAFVACLILLASTSAAQNQVWVVDPSGAGDFTGIAQAVNSVGSGDSLLVRPGTYSQSISIDQGLTIVADGSGPVIISAQLRVRNLGFTRDVVLSGLVLNNGFVAQDCVGLLRMQACTTPEPAAHDDWPGVPYEEYADCNVGQSRHEILSCRAVTLVDCDFRGAAGRGGTHSTLDGYPGHHALRVVDSDVALYGCTLIGGDGGDGWGSHFVVWAGAGGNGLYLSDAVSTARTDGLTAVGGAGGGSDPGSSFPSSVALGCPGQAIVSVTAGAVVPSAHPDLDFQAPAKLRGGIPEDITVAGLPGTGVFLIRSSDDYWRRLPAAIGVLHLVSPLQITALGTLSGTGDLTWPLSVPAPSALHEFVDLQLQVFGVTAGARYLSQPRQVLVVHPAL